MEYYLNVKLPETFGTDVASKQALTKVVRQQNGDGWELKSVDMTRHIARFVKTLENDDSHVNVVDSNDTRISIRLTGKEDMEELSRWVSNKYGEKFTLVSVEPLSKTAYFRVISVEEDRCRQAVAALFGQKPWDVSVKRRSDGGFSISLPVGYRPSRYDTQLDELAATTIGKIGWSFISDPASGTGEFIPGSPPTFPPYVLFEQAPQSQKWNEIYLGEKLGTKDNPDTQPLFTDLDINPHTLINGTTNSGKSVLVFALITGAILGGWDLAIVDPEKEGIDFEVFRPWIPQGRLATKLDRAEALMQEISDELGRRTNIIKSNGKRKWTELPEGTFNPMMVIIEEAASLLMLQPVPKGLDKEDEKYIATIESNALRSSIQVLIYELLRKARFAGIHLTIVSQTSKATNGLPPSMRELTSGRILTGTSPTATQRDTALKDSKSVPTVPSWIASDVDSRVARGVGVFEFDGMPSGVFKGAYIDTSDIPVILEKAGVPTRAEVLELEREAHVSQRD